MESFLVCIFLYSVQIWENTDHKKLFIWTLFTQWDLTKKSTSFTQQFPLFYRFYFLKKSHRGVLWKRCSENFLQNSQKNTCASASFLLKKRRSHRCFPGNFEKFLRSPFFIEHVWWLLPNKLKSLSFRCLPLRF